MRRAIAEKRKAYKLWQADRTEERKETYREKTRQAKRAVAAAKEAAWQDWCRDIGSAEGRRKMFKIAKQMKQELPDIFPEYIKGAQGRGRMYHNREEQTLLPDRCITEDRLGQLEVTTAADW